MPIHHFHCTDGHDVVLDRKGRHVLNDDVEGCATLAATRLMSQLPEFGDWSSWTVAVHDEDGCCVAIVPFPAGDAAATRPRARAGKLMADAWRTRQDGPLTRTA